MPGDDASLCWLSFAVTDERAAGEAVLLAMTRFFDPHYLRRQDEPPSEADAKRVLALVVAGLKAGTR